MPGTARRQSARRHISEPDEFTRVASSSEIPAICFRNSRVLRRKHLIGGVIAEEFRTLDPREFRRLTVVNRDVTFQSFTAG